MLLMIFSVLVFSSLIYEGTSLSCGAGTVYDAATDSCVPITFDSPRLFSENGNLQLVVPEDKDVSIIRKKRSDGTVLSTQSLFDLLADAQSYCDDQITKAIDAATTQFQLQLSDLKAELLLDIQNATTIWNQALDTSEDALKLKINNDVGSLGTVLQGQINASMVQAIQNPSPVAVNAIVNSMISSHVIQQKIRPDNDTDMGAGVQNVVNGMVSTGNLQKAIDKAMNASNNILYDSSGTLNVGVTNGSFSVNNNLNISLLAPLSPPSMKLTGYGRTPIFPVLVVNATCNASSTSEILCPFDDMTNAAHLLRTIGGAAHYRAASVGTKRYTHVLDFGAEFVVDALDLIGWSTGSWCEDGLVGGNYCHNDNSFSFMVATKDATDSSFVRPSYSFTESCSRLNDGCSVVFPATRVRFLKLLVDSGCSGCVNDDYISAVILWKVSPSTSQLLVSVDGKVGVGSATPAYHLDVAGSLRTSMGAYLQSDGEISALTVRTVGRSPNTPVRVALATISCNNIYCGEPACPADDSTNAQHGASAYGYGPSAEIVYQAASCGDKTYTHIFDYDSILFVDSFELKGRSTGHWCEDGYNGAGACHNDNNFSFQVSVDGVTYTTPDMLISEETCERLDDGCFFYFQPIYARYLRLKVVSGCQGCTNYDYVNPPVLYAKNWISAFEVLGNGTVCMQGRQIGVRSDGSLYLK